MAEDVEEYLARKFQNKLNLSSKVRFHGQFEKLSTLIQGILSSPYPKQRSINQELILLNNALEECRTLSLKKAAGSPNKAITLWRSLEKIRQDLEGIKKSMDDLANTTCLRRVEDRADVNWQVTTRRVNPSNVYGLEEKAASLERLLLGPQGADNFKAIGIVGMSGVGKTTMSQVIFDKPEVKDKFLPRIWVCVSPQPDTAEGDGKEAVARKILAHLGVSKKTTDSISSSHKLPGLLYAIHLQLTGKRYLIVLDNAVEKDQWYEMLGSCFKCEDGMAEWGKRLGYALPKGSGGAVILTTRSEEVGNLMVGRDNLHLLHPFSDPEICWKIFIDEVKRSEIDDIDNVVQSEKLKAELTKKCDGLPLAARVMGQLFVEKLNEKSKPKQGHP